MHHGLKAGSHDQSCSPTLAIMHTDSVQSSCGFIKCESQTGQCSCAVSDEQEGTGLDSTHSWGVYGGVGLATSMTVTDKLCVSMQHSFKIHICEK